MHPAFWLTWTVLFTTFLSITCIYRLKVHACNFSIYLSINRSVYVAICWVRITRASGKGVSSSCKNHRIHECIMRYVYRSLLLISIDSLVVMVIVAFCVGVSKCHFTVYLPYKHRIWHHRHCIWDTLYRNKSIFFERKDFPSLLLVSVTNKESQWLRTEASLPVKSSLVSGTNVPSVPVLVLHARHASKLRTAHWVLLSVFLGTNPFEYCFNIL